MNDKPKSHLPWRPSPAPLEMIPSKKLKKIEI